MPGAPPPAQPESARDPLRGPGGVVNEFGGKAEVNQYCGAANYGQPNCIYPWFTQGADGFRYGVNYPGTINGFGQADRFAQTRQCGGPFGPDITYCSTILP